MPALIQDNFNLPYNMMQGIFKKVQSTSTIAKLIGATPQQWGVNEAIILTGAPKAEIVDESGQKSPTPTTYNTVVTSPFKAQVTMRYSQEVMYADQARQLGVLQDMSANATTALSRQLDLAVVHKASALTGETSTKIREGLIDCPNVVKVSGTDYDKYVEQAAKKVLEGKYTPTAVALDPGYSFDIATMRDKRDLPLYPSLGFGQNVTDFKGMAAAVGDTVSGTQELKTASNLLGIVGQFSAIRWGVQAQIPVHLIEYGDPDGLGDLQRQNQIALRAEIFYSFVIMDKNAFCLIKKPTPTTGN